MGFFSCSLTRIERDVDRNGERVYALYTYDVVLAKWTRQDFPHTDNGLNDALQALRQRITQLDM